MIKPLLQGTSDRPLYRQLSDRLRADVAALRPGDRIPSEPELARQLGVSRFTVAKAIEALVDDGLLFRRQGKGTFVATPPVKRAPGYLRSFTEAVLAAGRQARSELLFFGPVEWTPGSPYPEREKLVGLDRLRFVDGMAIAIHRSVLSAATVADIGLTRAIAADPVFSLYQMFDRAGLSVVRGVEQLSARRPNGTERRLLRLADDAAVMAVRRASYAEDGRLLDFVSTVYDGQRYSYEALLLRDPNLGGARATKPAQESRHGEVVVHLQDFGPRLGLWDSDLGGGSGG